MSLTLTSAFTEKTIIKENWLFQLFYDDESASDFTGVSYYDTTVESVDYKGCVLNKVTIRESISLESSTAKTSNMSLSIANFDFNGNEFSRQFFNNTNKYINRKVKIYIQPDDSTAIADCVLIYIGKLEQVSHNHEKINLSIISTRPWDKISLDSDKSSNNVHEPIVYGNYTNTSNPAFSTNYNLYPIPFVGTLDNKLNFAEYKSVGSGHVSHYYDSQLDNFTTINSASSATSSFNSLDCVNVPSEVSKTFRIRPSTIENVSGFSNVANAINGSASDGATAGATVTSTGSLSGGYNEVIAQNNFKVKMPEIDGSATSITVHILGTIVQSNSEGAISGGAISGGGTNPKCIIGVSTHGQIIKEILKRQEPTDGTTNSSGTEINLTTGANGTGSDFSESDNTITYYNASKKLDEFEIYATYYSGTGSTISTDNYSSTWAVTIKDVIVQVSYQNDIANEPTASYAKNSSLKFVYSGTDGLNSIVDGSAVTYIHQAHYDLLRRHTSYGSVPTNYSTLNSTRDWQLRYWILEPTELIDVLEKLQYEGGFIGRFNGQGDFQYIFIPDSPSASVTLLKDDVSDINISLTPINNLTTKMDIEYEKHPAEGKYLSSATSVSANDATLLSEYNIASDENVKRVTLDAYVSPTIPTSASSNKNDDFYSYYQSIVGEPRLIVNLTVVNPKYLGLDVGDLVAYNDTFLPFNGKTGWDDYVFMVTDVSRSVGSLKITLRDVENG